MKKTYKKPSVLVVNVEAGSILCESDVIFSDNGILYGGVDNSGSKSPDARDALVEEIIADPNAWEMW